MIRNPARGQTRGRVAPSSQGILGMMAAIVEASVWLVERFHRWQQGQREGWGVGGHGRPSRTNPPLPHPVDSPLLLRPDSPDTHHHAFLPPQWLRGAAGHKEDGAQIPETEELRGQSLDLILSSFKPSTHFSSVISVHLWFIISYINFRDLKKCFLCKYMHFFHIFKNNFLFYYFINLLNKQDLNTHCRIHE